MAKNLKFNIKNTQIAAAVNLSGLTDTLSKKHEGSAQAAEQPSVPSPEPHPAQRSGVKTKEAVEQQPRVRARSRSAFSQSTHAPDHTHGVHEEAQESMESAIESTKNSANSAVSAEKKEASEHVPAMLLEAPRERVEPVALRTEESRDSEQQRVSHKPAKSMPSQEIKHEEPRLEPSTPVTTLFVSPAEEKAPKEKTSRETSPRETSPSVTAVSSPVTTTPSPLSTERPLPPKHESAREMHPSSAPRVAHQENRAFKSPRTAPPMGRAHPHSHPRPPAYPSSGGRATGAPSRFPASSERGPSERGPSGPHARSRAAPPRGEPRGEPRPPPSRPVQAHTERHVVRPSSPETSAPRPFVRDRSLFSAGKTPPPSVALAEAREKLGPTGKHVRDLLPPPKPPRTGAAAPRSASPAPQTARHKEEAGSAAKPAPRTAATTAPRTTEEETKKGGKTGRLKEFQDVKPVRRGAGGAARGFDARDRQGLRSSEEESVWRKRKNKTGKLIEAPVTVRPTALHVRLPISVKELAAEMKIKASQVIEKIFLQGLVRTINDFLDDPTLVELIGHELGCQLTIDTKEEDRIRITGQTVREEVAAAQPQQLVVRPPIVAFMGHVDHGKTSLIDAIRKSNRAAGEAGSITQHIGAFQCTTPVGNITVLDTPGHEAFSAMRARGADVTDIVVLVVAGDEGIRQQTIEAMEHAKAAQVTIVVAINKCDKPNFNADTVYRQLAEHELLPEAWGGHILTINCSAVTREGVPELLEMLALQSEVLELRADPTQRARGRVIESEMHKGMGATATILIQNGTLRKGDSLVFDEYWGRVKTMHNDLGLSLLEAGPSTPVAITGLSGLPEAGQEFIVVPSEREAREISEKRMLGIQQHRLQQAKRVSLESLTEQAAESGRKILYVVLRADMQGSLEALQTSLKKIVSKKVAVHVMSAGVGEISESDVQLAAMSKGVIIGFHTSVESHAESMIRQTGVQVHLHDIIYHAVDDVKVLMAGLLDRIAIETEKGKAEVLELFHSSQMGLITGCRIIEGVVTRQYPVRLRRGKDLVWQGSLTSLKRGKEDAREVQKGIECGMVLQGCKDVQKGDTVEAYEVTYITQEL